MEDSECYTEAAADGDRKDCRIAGGIIVESAVGEHDQGNGVGGESEDAFCSIGEGSIGIESWMRRGEV